MGSQVLSPKYYMDAYMATLLAGEPHNIIELLSSVPSNNNQ